MQNGPQGPVIHECLKWRAGFEPALGMSPHTLSKRATYTARPLILISAARCNNIAVGADGIARRISLRVRCAQEARCVVCTIFMADPIRADTSVMLLGTMRVVAASAATWL